MFVLLRRLPVGLALAIFFLLLPRPPLLKDVAHGRAALEQADERPLDLCPFSRERGFRRTQSDLAWAWAGRATLTRKRDLTRAREAVLLDRQ